MEVWILNSILGYTTPFLFFFIFYHWTNEKPRHKIKSERRKKEKWKHHNYPHESCCHLSTYNSSSYSFRFAQRRVVKICDKNAHTMRNLYAIKLCRYIVHVVLCAQPLNTLNSVGLGNRSWRCATYVQLYTVYTVHHTIGTHSRRQFDDEIV